MLLERASRESNLEQNVNVNLAMRYHSHSIVPIPENDVLRFGQTLSEGESQSPDLGQNYVSLILEEEEDSSFATSFETSYETTGFESARCRIQLGENAAVVKSAVWEECHVNETMIGSATPVSDPDEDAIISARTGTVRGFKNRVRRGIESFTKRAMENSMPKCEEGRIIVYTTTLRVIRKAFERCHAIKSIFQTHMVRYEERDINKHKEHRRELRDRLGVHDPEVPQVFINGEHLGDFDNIQKLNEIGDLRKILTQFQRMSVRPFCDHCGGYRFLPCQECSGSKKKLHNFTSLRCLNCNEDGLVRCTKCIDQQE